VIAGTIVTGTAAEEYIPSRLRHYISAESAINDGVAYLLLFLPLLLLRHSTDTALREWVFVVLLKEVLLAAFVGFVIGYFAGRLQRWATARDFIVKPSLLTIVVALTFAVLGFIKLFGADGILARVHGGCRVQTSAEEEAVEQEQDAQEALERLFEIPVFVIFGMMLPWQGGSNSDGGASSLRESFSCSVALPSFCRCRNSCRHSNGEQMRSSQDGSGRVSSTEREVFDQMDKDDQDVAVESASIHIETGSHPMRLLYVPSTSGEGTAVFATNLRVGPEEAESFCRRYSRRWQIENEYKSIKHDFLCEDIVERLPRSLVLLRVRSALVQYLAAHRLPAASGRRR